MTALTGAITPLSFIRHPVVRLFTKMASSFQPLALLSISVLWPNTGWMKALLLTVLTLLGGAMARSAEMASTNWMARILTNDEALMTNAQSYWKVMTNGPALATNANSFFKIMTAGSLAERRRAELDFFLAACRNGEPAPTATADEKALWTQVMNIRNKIQSGDSTEKEFRLYCGTVDAMLTEFAEERQRPWAAYDARFGTYIRFITFDVQMMTGEGFYLNRKLWADRKKQLEALQKWKRTP